jgi:hypothetical protein
VKRLDPQKGKAIARVVFAIFLLVAIVLMVKALMLGATADRCAEELAQAAEKHDAAYLDRTVKSPSAREKLAAAHHVELGFVRPLSSDWSRVGLFVKPTATATRAEVVLLRLSASTPDCEFLRDYEPGAFQEQ